MRATLGKEMKTTLTTKGQLTLPKKVREALGLKPGDELLVEVEDDRIMLIPRRRYRAEELDRLIPKAQKPFPGLKAEKEAAAWARLEKERS